MENEKVNFGIVDRAKNAQDILLSPILMKNSFGGCVLVEIVGYKTIGHDFGCNDRSYIHVRARVTEGVIAVNHTGSKLQNWTA